MTFACWLAAACFCQAAHAETLRDREIATCRPEELVTWQDGVDRPSQQPAWRVIYRHAGAPAWFSGEEVRQLVHRAAEAWSRCGVTMSLVTADEPEPSRPDVVIVQWHERDSRGNFGLADLRQRRLSLGPQAFALLRNRNPGHPALETLQMTISHELGHFMGLMAHSRRCVDVLSYYHDGKGGRCALRDPAAFSTVAEYRHLLPTACDIERCRAINQRPSRP